MINNECYEQFKSINNNYYIPGIYILYTIANAFDDVELSKSEQIAFANVIYDAWLDIDHSSIECLTDALKVIYSNRKNSFDINDPCLWRDVIDLYYEMFY